MKPVHTLDLVVLAAEWGHGRRTGWLSNLHLGARGDDGTFVMVGKTFKGLTDELLRWQTEALQAIARSGPRRASSSTCGRSSSSRSPSTACRRRPATRAGVALRFARVRRYRPDKSPADADTITAVQSMLRLIRGVLAADRVSAARASPQQTLGSSEHSDDQNPAEDQTVSVPVTTRSTVDTSPFSGRGTSQAPAPGSPGSETHDGAVGHRRVARVRHVGRRVDDGDDHHALVADVA